MAREAKPTSEKPMKATPDTPGPVRPFIKASRERTLLNQAPATTAVLGAAQQGPHTVYITSGGFLRAVWIDVVAAGGVAGLNNAVLTEDAPFNVLQNFTLQDVNGNILVGPFSGHTLYLIDKYGGYEFQSDPRMRENYTGGGNPGNFAFSLRIPIEISGRDAYGCLPNQNSSQQFKAEWFTAASASVFSAGPDTKPTVTYSIGVEIWDQPPSNGPRGEENELFPPGLGATQYWRPSVYDLQSGDVTQRLSRVGNSIRNLIMIYRNSAGTARTTTNFPSSYRLQIDDKAYDHITRVRHRNRMNGQYGYTGTAEAAGALDTGVFVWNMDHDLDGKPGWSNRLGLLDTHEGTKLEFIGQTGAAGQLTVLTNDIATRPVDEVMGKL
jgi:hypothetical protein